MESANHSFNVHAYCLTPDHLLAEGIEPTSDPLHFVKILKIESSRQYAAQPGGAKKILRPCPSLTGIP